METLDEAAATPGTGSASASGPVPDADRFNGEKVLIVDDEADTVEELQEYLEDLGLQVVMAINAVQAIEALTRDENIHLVVTDIRMPRIDGFSFIEYVAQLPHWMAREIRFIVITGHVELSEAQRSLRMGLSDFLAKPLEPAELARAVRRALDELRAAANRRQRETSLAQEVERLREETEGAAAECLMLRARLDLHRRRSAMTAEGGQLDLSHDPRS